MKKKLISLLLVLALLAALAPAALAAELPFADVSSGAWYRPAVEYVYENQLFNGTSTNAFSPNGSMTRAMLVTVLHRLAGAPDSDAQTPFTDLEPDTWYTEAVSWAYENQVVNGTSATTFSPKTPVTREQMVTILYRYAQDCGYDCSASNRLYAFADRNTIHDYAKTAFSWAVGSGIITGVTDTTLKPAGTATRAQVATIIMRFVYVFDSDPTNDPAIPDDPDEPAPTPIIPVSPSAESIEVSGCSYRIGMTLSQLLGQAGQPDETLATIAGYTWYIYGTETYQDFFMAGIYNSAVVALCGSGPGFSYMGKKMGSAAFTASSSSCTVQIMTDSNDNNIMHCVLLTSRQFYSQSNCSTATLANESKVDFHLVNAFRAYHGLSILRWNSAAAEAARLHSVDMASRNYFSHDSLDGRTVGDRLVAQGISWMGYAENIAAGYRSGVAVHDGWVNSSGHRSNMLLRWITELGVGGGYSSSSSYGYYYTEDYVTVR